MNRVDLYFFNLSDRLKSLVTRAYKHGFGDQEGIIGISPNKEIAQSTEKFAQQRIYLPQSDERFDLKLPLLSELTGNGGIEGTADYLITNKRVVIKNKPPYVVSADPESFYDFLGPEEIKVVDFLARENVYFSNIGSFQGVIGSFDRVFPLDKKEKFQTIRQVMADLNPYLLFE